MIDSVNLSFRDGGVVFVTAPIEQHGVCPEFQRLTAFVFVRVYAPLAHEMLQMFFVVKYSKNLPGYIEGKSPDKSYFNQTIFRTGKFLFGQFPPDSFPLDNTLIRTVPHRTVLPGHFSPGIKANPDTSTWTLPNPLRHPQQ